MVNIRKRILLFIHLLVKWEMKVRDKERLFIEMWI